MNKIIKRHIIKIRTKNSENWQKLVEDGLQQVLGINDVRAEKDSGRITITYNLRFIDYHGLELKLNKIGYVPAKGFYYTLKRWFINFTEKYESDRYKLQPPPYGISH